MEDNWFVLGYDEKYEKYKKDITFIGETHIHLMFRGIVTSKSNIRDDQTVYMKDFLLFNFFEIRKNRYPIKCKIEKLNSRHDPTGIFLKEKDLLKIIKENGAVITTEYLSEGFHKINSRIYFVYEFTLITMYEDQIKIFNDKICKNILNDQSCDIILAYSECKLKDNFLTEHFFGNKEKIVVKYKFLYFVLDFDTLTRMKNLREISFEKCEF